MTDQEETKPDYEALRKEFAEWLMYPLRGTQAEWAKEHNVHESTLSTWKADPEFAALIKDWRERAKVAIPAMLRSVIDRVIKTGDPRAFQAVMESLGETSQRIDVNASQPFMDLQKKLVELRQAASVAAQSVEPPQQPRPN
jgi:hypothetical protein